MYVTPEIINLVVNILSIGATVVGGVWWLLHRYEKRVGAQFGKIDAQFGKIDARFDKIDARFDKVDGELQQIRQDVGGVKERVARLEGPENRLQFR